MSSITIEQATADLMRAMRRALVERRETVEIEGFMFRFQRRDEKFFDHLGGAFQAVESGVFVLFPVQQGDAVVGGRWVYHGSSDDLEDIMKRYIGRLSATEIEGYAVGIAAAAALRRDLPQRKDTSTSTPSRRPSI